MEIIAFITGINGQDGSYLAEFLLEKKYIIYGIIRRSSNLNTTRIDHISDKLNLFYGDITDLSCLINILDKIKNKHNGCTIEIYNLAAQSHVQISFDNPIYTTQVDAIGTLNVLEAIRLSNYKHKIKLYQASTSELYGDVKENQLDELSKFNPQSPYATAKLYGYWIIKNYRESYNIFACNGILFNHESPRRTYNFVTRKITIGLGKILRGEENKLTMGNIDSVRDWGHAKDYVEGMWKILQYKLPEDWVLATNKIHTVREFIELAFLYKGFNIKWKGTGINEIGYDKNTGRELIFIDKKYFRKSEVSYLKGDYSKAREKLNWTPKITFDQLLKEMVDTDTQYHKSNY